MKTKKSEKPKIVKTETMEEYLARGGQITKAPAHEAEELTHTLPVKTTIDHNLMSLGEGEYLFGEIRVRKPKVAKKRVTNEEFTAALDSSDLPPAIVETLKAAMRKK